MVLLLSFPLLPLTVEAQSSSDPWWGPSDRSDPTRGWAVRVPVVVQNDRTYALRDAIVAADIDFGKLLVRAGWTNRTAGTEATLRGFTLDVESIRVVEYGPGFAPGPIQGSGTPPLPHTFYTAPLEASHHRDFDAQRNPSGTVMFLAKGLLAPAQKRYFYVYANPIEFGKTAPHEGDLAERSPLDAFMWGSSGTVTYGYEPQQQGTDNAIHIRPLTSEKTRVEVYTYSLGRFTLAPASGAYRNPFDIPAGTMADSAFFVPGGTPFKIVSDRPIVVQATGSRAVPENSAFAPGDIVEATGFIPATNGSYAGNDFWVYSYRKDPTRTVGIVKASTAGTITVTATGPTGASYGPVQLTSSKPTNAIQLLGGQDGWYNIRATGGNILASYHALAAGGAPATGFGRHPVPAVTGGPVGDDFYDIIPVDGGFFRMCAESPARTRVIDPMRPSISYLPEGPIDATAPHLIEPTTGCFVFNATSTTPASAMEIYTVKGEGDARPGRMSVLAGAWSRAQPDNTREMVGHYGGQRGVNYSTLGPVGIFGVYNDTRVQVYVERTKQNVPFVTNQSPFAISQDGYQVIDPFTYADATGRMRIVANKPVSVVSVSGASHQYERFVPGRPENPHVEVGAAEFRGPLVELRSREKDGRQDFRSTGPGTAVTFPLEVINLGRWVAGESLVDTISLRCTGPDGWLVAGCQRDITLGSGQAERIDVAITPPSDALNINGTFQVEARSKTGAASSTFKLIVFVEIRYGVGMWFDVEGGRKSIDPATGVDPGETYRYDIVIKNTGSARDKFDITVEDARPGWTQELLLESEPVTSIELDGGEARTLTFAVTAPNTETAAHNIVRIDARSVSSALAADVVNTATRIRPKININLDVSPTTRVAEPNETATFNLTVRNSGNDIFRILFTQESLLPKGWNATLGLTEIDLGPGEPYTFPLRVTPPQGARAGDLATVKITAETDTGGGGARVPGDQVSAVIVVRKIHNVNTTALLDAAARPGETLQYVVPLKNEGNGNDIVELLPGAVDPPWKVTARVQSLALDADATEEFPLTIEVPDGTPPGAYNLSVGLRLTREAVQNITLPIVVEATARVAFRGLDDVSLVPGRAQLLGATATNTGNVPGTFVLSSTQPDGWNVTFAPERLVLAPGESLPVSVSLNATREAADGSYRVTLDAALAGAAAGSTPLTVRLARPELRIERVDGQGTVRPGELILVTATVSNKGKIAAENVTVALVVDGQAVDTVVLGRIPINASSVATLNWLATKRTSDVKVVLDPQSEIAQPSRDAHEATVSFGTKLFAPGPGAALLVAAAAALALAARSIHPRRRDGRGDGPTDEEREPK